MVWDGYFEISSIRILREHCHVQAYQVPESHNLFFEEVHERPHRACRGQDYVQDPRQDLFGVWRVATWHKALRWYIRIITGKEFQWLRDSPAWNLPCRRWNLPWSLGKSWYYHSMLQLVLDVLVKSFSNVTEITDDKLSTNKAMTTDIGWGFIGCLSHMFNSAVKDVIDKEMDSVDEVHALMKKIRNVIPAAKLREFTSLKNLLINVTYWSSNYAMLSR